jgi:hypothetical protein
VNVAGFDGWEERDVTYRAPGDHAAGMASHLAGGGGNATVGGKGRATVRAPDASCA